MLKFLFFALFFATVFIFSCADYPRINEIENTLRPGDDFIDTRNNQTYKTVIIGDQIWMARNLNYRGTEPDTLGVCYDNKPSNCQTYGRLYDWAMAMDLDESYNQKSYGHDPKHQGICPEGWHLPSNTEWQTLVEYIGAGANMGVKLRAKSGWSDKADNGDDDYGFSALPSGHCCEDKEPFENLGTDELGFWWSSTEYITNSKQAYFRDIAQPEDKVSARNAFKTYMFAVRCIKD
jgi:uncharacterized protein (TIGR02145 family)